MSDLVKRLREGLTVLDEPYHYPEIARAMSEAADEIERLAAGLLKANKNHEHFEREWYLRGDRIAKLEAVRKAAADYMEHQWDEPGDDSFDRLERTLQEVDDE